MSPAHTPMPMHLVLLGPPACGKGTQGRRLSARLGLPYLSTGSLLRSHVEQSTEVGRVAKPILDRGAYLPDELMCRMVTEWIDGQPEGWVLDGFPRSLGQALYLDQWLAERGQSLTAALALEASFEVLGARIHGRLECPECRWSGAAAEVAGRACPDCGGGLQPRADDTTENFSSRHRAYLDSVLPVIDHYRGRGVLCSCDATAPRDEVTAQLLDHLVPAPGRPLVAGRLYNRLP